MVLALSQIQSKGYVSAEEINQIAERLPQIRTLMLAAFGTASSEAIKDLGLSSEQFIEGITTQLEKLPRASGGIKNSLENFSTPSNRARPSSDLPFRRPSICRCNWSNSPPVWGGPWPKDSPR